MSNDIAEDNAAKQRGLVLAEISKWEKDFPHLDFEMLVLNFPNKL